MREAGCSLHCKSHVWVAFEDEKPNSTKSNHVAYDKRIQNENQEHCHEGMQQHFSFLAA